MSKSSLTHEKDQSAHLPTIDILRGIAVSLVLLLHFHLSYHLTEGFFEFLPSLFLKRLVNNGNYGVVIFFVISGFLITSRTILRFGSLGKMRVKNFYSFRIGRIFPNILLMLTVVVALADAGVAIFQNNHATPSMAITIVSILTFTHNLLMEQYGYFNYCLNILWSLSVEEVFYLTFPLICLLLRRDRWIALVWTIFIFIAPLYRFLHKADDTDIFVLYDYRSCFDGIAIGCLVAILQSNVSIPSSIRKFRFLCAIGMITVYFWRGIFSNVVIGISLMSLLAGGVILLMPSGSKPSLWLKLTFPLRWLGALSYELYLFHIIVLAGLKTLVPANQVTYAEKPVLFLVFIGVSVLVAKLISRLYSEPLNRFIRTYLTL